MVIRVASDTEVTLVGNTLTITDVTDGDSDDDLQISFAGGLYTITDLGGLTIDASTIAGSSGSGTDSVTIPQGSIDAIDVVTLAGNDTVTVVSTNTGDGVTIDGGDDADIVHWNSTATIGGLAITAETIQLDSGSIDSGVGNQEYNGAVLLAANTILTGADVTFLGTVDSGTGGSGVLPSVGSGTLLLNLDADLGVATIGSTVTSWTDQSGNGFVFNAVDAPELVSNVINGQSVIRFDGSNDRFVSSTAIQLFPTNSSGLTVFTVFDTDNNSGQKFLVNHGNTAGQTFELGYDTGSGIGNGNFGLHRGSSNAVVANANTIANDTFYVMSTVISTSGTTPTNVEFFQDGTALSDSTNLAGWLSARLLRAGFNPAGHRRPQRYAKRQHQLFPRRRYRRNRDLSG